MQGIVSPSVRLYLDPSLRQASAVVQDEAGAHGSLGGGAGGGAVGGGGGGAHIKRKAVSSVFAGFLDPMDVRLDAIHVLHDRNDVNLVPETKPETLQLLEAFKQDPKQYGDGYIAAVLDRDGNFSLYYERKLVKALGGDEADTAFSALSLQPLKLMTSWLNAVLTQVRQMGPVPFFRCRAFCSGNERAAGRVKARVREKGYFTDPTTGAFYNPWEADAPFLKFVRDVGYTNAVQLLAETIVQMPHDETNACVTARLGPLPKGEGNIETDPDISIFEPCHLGHTKKDVIAAAPSSTSGKPPIPGATYPTNNAEGGRRRKKGSSVKRPPSPIRIEHWARFHERGQNAPKDQKNAK